MFDKKEKYDELLKEISKEKITGKEAILEQIEKFYKDENLTRDELFEKLYNFQKENIIGNLFGFGYGITKIVTQSRWENPEDLQVITLKGFRPWLCWLFDKNFETEERKRGR